jgi:hypothetical protein
VAASVLERWRGSRLHRMLQLGGYVAFDLPRTVTALGDLLLLGIVATHVYILSTETALPRYFVIYAVVLIAGCLLAAGAVWLNPDPLVPRLAWFLGSIVALIFIAVYLASRMASLPGLVAVTGRWDFAPGTFAAAFAVAFVAVHMSVLLGINVAYPDRQGWQD